MVSQQKHCKKRKSYNVTLDSIYDKCNDLDYWSRNLGNE